MLTAALAQDSEVRQTFPEDIYWLTAGQKPNLLDLQNRLLRQLTGSKETLITEQKLKGALREAIEGRTRNRGNRLARRSLPITRRWGSSNKGT